jgi:hypothetical protein
MMLLKAEDCSLLFFIVMETTISSISVITYNASEPSSLKGDYDDEQKYVYKTRGMDRVLIHVLFYSLL